MRSSLKAVVSDIVTIGGISEVPFATFLVLILSIGVLYAFAFIGEIRYQLSDALFIGFIVFSLLAQVIALYVPPYHSPEQMVINRTIGFLIAFLHIPIQAKLVVTGLVLYLIIRQEVMRFKYRHLNLSGKSPAIIMAIAPDIITGVIVKVFFSFVFWLTR